MAGFKRKTTLDITWKKGHELHGLEVSMRKLSIGKMAAFAGLADLRKQGVTGTEALRVFDDVTGSIAESLVSWNLTEDVDVKDDAGNVVGTEEKPVPATLDGVRAQDLDFVFELMSAWMDLGVGVSDPLSKSSSDGLPSLEASLPMEPLSPSPVS